LTAERISPVRWQLTTLALKEVQSVIAMKLDQGDRIGVVSPSTPTTPGDLKLDKGVRFLKDMGFQVILGKHVFSRTWGYCASPQEKAADINNMFADQSIKAIICSQGGDTA